MQECSKLLSQLDILARHCDKFELFVRCIKDNGDMGNGEQRIAQLLR